MRHRYILMLASVLLAILVLPSASSARVWTVAQSGARQQSATVKSSSKLPRLLVEDFSRTFAVRPARIIPTGDGSGVLGKLFNRRGHSLQWRSWTHTNAYGVGTVWLDDGIPDEADGTFHGYDGTLHAYRVLHGRFTRVLVCWHAHGKLQTWLLRLQADGPGYIW